MTEVYYKMHQLFYYYKLRRFYYKMRRLLQIVTVHSFRIKSPLLHLLTGNRLDLVNYFN